VEQTKRLDIKNGRTIDTERRLVLILALIWGLIVFRDLIFTSIPFGLFSVYIMLFIIISKPQERLIIITALIPFSRGIPLSEIILLTLVYEAIENPSLQKL
jgi:hypothetical protein